jgi:hypothetical protein
MTSIGSQQGLVLWSNKLPKLKDFKEYSKSLLHFALACPILGDSQSVRNPCLSIYQPTSQVKEEVPGKAARISGSWLWISERANPHRTSCHLDRKGNGKRREKRGRKRWKWLGIWSRSREQKN